MTKFKELFTEETQCKSKTLFDDARKAWNKYNFNKDTGGNADQFYKKAKKLYDCIKKNNPDGLPSNHNLPSSMIKEFGD